MDDKNTPQALVEPVEQKQPYEKPTLAEYGNVTELTRGVTGVISERTGRYG